MPRNARDNPEANPAFTVTNWTEDVALNCNTVAGGETEDILGTLIKQLIDTGVIQGTVSA
jgi:hypothetical protein